MKRIEQYVRKKVLVIGLAKSGIAAARLLHDLGAFVTVNDKGTLEDNPAAQALLEEGITVICGGHPVDLLDEGFSLVVKNPGIFYSNPMVERAMELGLPVVTEVELAYEISSAPFIAITGTNGKTTTTTLIYEMLLAGGLRPLIAGNIGTVACEVAQRATADDIIVMEMSSFQLMGTSRFRPHVALFLNLFDTHLDYHGSRAAYFEAKMKIAANQTASDFFVYNGKQPELVEAANHVSAIALSFSLQKQSEQGAYLEDGMLCFRGEPIVSVEKIALQGEHSLENSLAAVAVAKLVGCSNEAIAQVLATFRGVEHRFQFVRELNGRAFFNDSKATNILAASKALESVKGPTILLAGGLDRGNEFDELAPFLGNVKALVTFGQTAQKIANVAREAGINKIAFVEDVGEAAEVAYKLSEEGDTILLSPACASWDQYKSFEDRGVMFVQAVHKLE